MMLKYNPIGAELLEIKKTGEGTLKITGKMHAAVKLEVAKLIERASQYRLPDSWEDTI